MSPRPARARRARPPESSRAVESGRPPTGGPVRSDSGKNGLYSRWQSPNFAQGAAVRISGVRPSASVSSADDCIAPTARHTCAARAARASPSKGSVR